MSQGKQGVETSGGATVDGLVGCSRVEAQREHVRAEQLREARVLVVDEVGERLAAVAEVEVARLEHAAVVPAERWVRAAIKGWAI